MHNKNMMGKLCVVAGLAATLSITMPLLAQHTGHPGMGQGMGHDMGQGQGHVGQGMRNMGMESHHMTHNPDQLMRMHGKTASQILARNQKLSSRLAALLPPGTDLQGALQGFSNLGQFIAAVHVSHNLGIPFSQLKDKMLGPPKMSLGKALHALRPRANTKTALGRAHNQARTDLRVSGAHS